MEKIIPGCSYWMARHSKIVREIKVPLATGKQKATWKVPGVASLVGRVRWYGPGDRQQRRATRPCGERWHQEPVAKARVLAEAYRVLRPGGRLQRADILLEDGVTPEEVAKKGSWSD